MTVRRWTFQDLAAIAALEETCFRDAWSYRMLADSFLLGGFCGYLAEENGVLLGIVAIQRAADQADLLRVAVREESRRRGVADELLGVLFAEALMTGIRAVYLEVRASNAPAIALYRKHGFYHVALRKNYYGEEDAVVMKKEFCESE